MSKTLPQVKPVTALLPDPPQGELLADDMVPDLFRRFPFDVQENCQRLVTAIPRAVRAGNFDLAGRRKA